jgi:hypothetical protein
VLINPRKAANQKPSSRTNAQSVNARQPLVFGTPRSPLESVFSETGIRLRDGAAVILERRCSESAFWHLANEITAADTFLLNWDLPPSASGSKASTTPTRYSEFWNFDSLILGQRSRLRAPPFRGKKDVRSESNVSDVIALAAGIYNRSGGQSMTTKNVMKEPLGSA